MNTIISLLLELECFEASPFIQLNITTCLHFGFDPGWLLVPLWPFPVLQPEEKIPKSFNSNNAIKVLILLFWEYQKC
jgi:hypothetical protein